MEVRTAELYRYLDQVQAATQSLKMKREDSSIRSAFANHAEVCFTMQPTPSVQTLSKESLSCSCVTFDRQQRLQTRLASAKKQYAIRTKAVSAIATVV